MLSLGNVSFSHAGVYTLVVSGEGGSVGQFVLSLQPSTPLPNLTIINVRLTVTGADLNAGITIMNSGTAPLTPDQTFSIITCIDGFDNCNEDRAGVTLQPGETVIVSTIVPAFMGAGSHSVNITLDERSEIAELNESDNSAFSSFNS